MVHEALIKLRRSLCEVMSALPWSIRMFCYFCPLGSCVSLRGGTGCSTGEPESTKGQAAA